MNKTMILPEGENGVVVNGQYYRCDWFEDIFSIIVERVLQSQAINLEKQKNEIDDEVYTVKEVSKMLKRSISTITLHCRIGILKGNKVGKTWLIPHEAYLNYKYSLHD